MKKILLLLMTCCAFITHAQVKIGDNPTTVGSSSSLELESTNRALVITRVANTAAIATPVNGMIVYDISSNCIKAYEDGTWTNCLSNGSNIEPSTNGSAKVNSYTCTTGSTGTMTSGIEVSGTGVTQTITADVTQLGTFSLTCFANGIVFSKSGTFTTLGSQNIVLDQAYGVPVDTGNFAFTLNTLPTCSFTRTVLGNPSTNGSAIVSGYVCNTDSVGTLTVGTPASGVTQTITATVTTVGTYNITAEINGVTFSSGVGTFAGTGAQQVVLTATGTPTTAGSNSFTLNTTPNCSFTRDVISPTSGGTAVVSAYNCSGTATGTLTEGTAASGVTQVVTATVTTVGTYSITIPAVNGVSWSSGTLTFAGTGSQNITLTASGTPTTAGTSTFPLPTTPTCSFTRSVGEAFTSTSCTSSFGTFPTTTTVGSTSVTVTKTTATDGGSVANSDNCSLTATGNSLILASGQSATLKFTVPVKNLQLYLQGLNTSENGDTVTVTAKLAGIDVPIQLTPFGGTCQANIVTTQSGNSATIAAVSGETNNTFANVSASGAYDEIIVTRVVATGAAYVGFSLCNATAVPNTTSGGSAVVSAYSCSGATTGTLLVGTAASGVTKTITATVTTAGGYIISTTEANGITWSGSGTFLATGSQDITLTAAGTPIDNALTTHTLNTTPDCSFTSSAANPFVYTGSLQSVVVPAGATSMYFYASGAAGGGSTASFGKGAEVSGTIAVTPGETIYAYVGGKPTSETPVYGFAGFGGIGANGNGYAGGGLSAVSTSATIGTTGLIAVAGGGGGASFTYTGGGAGGTSGADGGFDSTFYPNTRAFGGSQVAGGAAGVPFDPQTIMPEAGSSLAGGRGGSVGSPWVGGGGGGGGYFGGGGGVGGGSANSAGGGGSSWVSPSATGTTNTGNLNGGNGYVYIQFNF